MVSGIEAAAAGMMSFQNLNDVIANNLANVNTAGFKQLIPTFKNISNIQIKDKSVNNNYSNNDNYIGKLSSGSALDSTMLDLKQGALRKTDNKLDFAISGQGFFTVGTQNGDCYTRNGSFSINNEGNLVTQDGNPVLNTNGSVVKIDIKTSDIDKLNVSEDGTIFFNNNKVDKLKIVDFEKSTDLITIGNSFYKTSSNDVNSIEAKNCKINQGFIEGSNSSSIENMINSISATRTYEALSKVIKTTETTLDKAVNDVGRIKE